MPADSSFVALPIDFSTAGFTMSGSRWCFVITFDSSTLHTPSEYDEATVGSAACLGDLFLGPRKSPKFRPFLG